MYIAKKEIKKVFDGRPITYVADKLGISRVYLSNIVNGNTACSKITAYCIVKFFDSEAEIDDYFKKAK